MSKRDPGADVTDLYQTNDVIALTMGRLAAQRITPERVREFRRFLDFLRRRHGDNKYLQIWETIVESGTEALSNMFTEPSERGQVLRSVISFRAFVSKSERDEIFREQIRATGGEM
jgi:hypothetical protein